MAETVATRYAGTRVQRVEDSRLLTGHGTFVDDVSRPGMLHACFVRSPFARARINDIDASAALDLPGVYAVFTAEDLNTEVKGGAIGSTPAVINAINDALAPLGVSLAKLPASPAAIMSLLEEARRKDED